MMTGFPAIPDWNGIHPATVQFPIVLLFVAPLLLLVSLFTTKSWRPWAGASLIMMTLGTLAAWLAVGSGHAAGQLVDKTGPMAQVLARHEAFGVLTRNVFTGLTAVLALLMLIPAMMKKPLPAALRITGFALFVVAYALCTTTLANTAYRGGRLVHEFGVRAMVANQRAELVSDEVPARAGEDVNVPKPVKEPAARPLDRKQP
jgi:uncharacterized membrane protein